MIRNQRQLELPIAEKLTKLKTKSQAVKEFHKLIAILNSFYKQKYINNPNQNFQELYLYTG